MKRNFDLIREILIALEERQSTLADTVEITGYSMEEIAYNCELLYSAGFVNSYNPLYASDSLEWFSVGSLTWEGSEYLSKIRSGTVWNKIKSVISSKGIPLSIDVVKTIGTQLALDMARNTLQ